MVLLVVWGDGGIGIVDWWGNLVGGEGCWDGCLETFILRWVV